MQAEIWTKRYTSHFRCCPILLPPTSHKWERGNATPPAPTSRCMQPLTQAPASLCRAPLLQLLGHIYKVPGLLGCLRGAVQSNAVANVEPVCWFLLTLASQVGELKHLRAGLPRSCMVLCRSMARNLHSLVTHGWRTVRGISPERPCRWYHKPPVAYRSNNPFVPAFTQLEPQTYRHPCFRWRVAVTTPSCGSLLASWSAGTAAAQLHVRWAWSWLGPQRRRRREAAAAATLPLGALGCPLRTCRPVQVDAMTTTTWTTGGCTVLLLVSTGTVWKSVGGPVAYNFARSQYQCGPAIAPCCGGRLGVQFLCMCLHLGASARQGG